MKYIVTIRRTITTEVVVEADSLADARKDIEAYGPDLAAVDMASQDVETSAKVTRVRKAVVQS